MAAIAAVRMAKAAFTAMFSAMSGAGSGMSDAIIEAGEAVLGMLLISASRFQLWLHFWEPASQGCAERFFQQEKERPQENVNIG